MHLKKCDISGLKGNVLMRVDLNLPEHDTQLSQHPRMTATIGLLKQLLMSDKVEKIIIMSHRGRPSGLEEALSLQPYLSLLEQAILCDIFFVQGNILPSRHHIDNQPCRVILLDNLRFHIGEEKNDSTFARQLATLGDVYINNAMSVVHRKHASVSAILGEFSRISRYAGPALIWETERLNELVCVTPNRPLLAILGGAKLTDKLPLALRLVQLADVMAIGGAFATAPQTDLAQLQWACDVYNTRLIIPNDLVRDDSGLVKDIGPESVASICQAIKDAKSVFWNGPVGKFENVRFASGTSSIADCLHQEFIQRSEQGFTSVIGGGDTVQAFGKRQASFICTAGGAATAFLVDGYKLPGLRKLITS